MKYRMETCTWVIGLDMRIEPSIPPQNLSAISSCQNLSCLVPRKGHLFIISALAVTWIYLSPFLDHFKTRGER